MDFSKTEKTSRITPMGERLLKAFSISCGLTDKKIIAEKLGFQSEKAIYKVINGEQEMSFRALRHFREETEHSIDWLLAGDTVPDKDDWISVRTLLMYGPRLNDIEALWREYNEKNPTHDLSFHEFLGELVRRGYEASFPNEASQFTDWIKGLVRTELEDADLDRIFEKAYSETIGKRLQKRQSGELGPLKKTDIMLARSLGTIGAEDVEQEKKRPKRKTG